MIEQAPAAGGPAVRSAHSTRSGLRRMANHPRVIITSRFSQRCSLATERTHARNYDHLLNKTKTERPNDHEFAKNSRGSTDSAAREIASI